MCLAVPGKLLAIDDAAEPRMGTASFGGMRTRVCLAWVPEASIGDYVIVHVGFAISRMDEAEASKTLALYQQMADAHNAPTDRPASAPTEERAGDEEEGGASALR